MVENRRVFWALMQAAGEAIKREHAGSPVGKGGAGL
jgi:hypothetical protein